MISMAAGLAPIQRGGATGLLRPLSRLWSASSASSPSCRRGLIEEQRFSSRWAFSNVGPVTPRRTHCGEGDRGRPNRMVAEADEQSGGPLPQQQLCCIDEFLVRGSSSQFQAEVASMDWSQRNWSQQQLSSQTSQGASGHGIVAQLEAQSPETCAGASNRLEAVTMIEQNRNPCHKLVGGIKPHQRNTDFLKVEVGPVLDIKPCFTRSLAANYLLEIRQPELFSRDEEGKSSAICEDWMRKNSARQDLTTEEVLRKAFPMHGRSSPASISARLNITHSGRLQSRASFSSRDWSRDTPQGNSRRHMHGEGNTTEAIAGLQNRLQRGINIVSSTYIKILQMCLQQNDLLAAKQVHDCVIKSGMDKNPYVAGTVLSVYIKCGALVDARRVFDELEKKTVIHWNSMIAAYAKNGNAESAFELFKLMRQKGAPPNKVTYLCILKACASPSALKWGKEVHVCIRHAGFESDVRIGSALLQMYAKSGRLDDARLAFDKMNKRDVIVWTIMIGAYAGSGHGVEAYGLFLQMRREGFEPDAFTYASILNASASAGALEWVKEVHGSARKAGLESDLRVGNALVHMYAKSGSLADARLVFDRMEKRHVITWNIMIGAYAEIGRGMEAYGLFLQMRREGFEPNAITYISILNASASSGPLEWVKKVHGHALKAGLESDLQVGSAFIHMFAKSGSLDDARLVFDRMEKRNVVTWNTMIVGLAQHGSGREALQLFKKMNADLVKPNESTFVGVLSACCHAGLLDDGHRLFSAMKQDYGIEPDILHYTCMVDLLGRAGLLEKAKLFISDMPVEPDVVTWGALLGACRTYGNVELGELAANEMFKLEPNNAFAYVLLSNIYAAAGKWEKVSSVRTMMKNRGVWKEPGRSWIEVDNKIHEFIVGDTSHPEAKGIHTYMNKLTDKLKAEGYIPDTQTVLQNIDEEDKELALCSHSEKLAIAFGLMRLPSGKPIRVFKNLRVCSDCHTATKFISKVTQRQIIARDANRFHHFKDGVCSCGDYW